MKLFNQLLVVNLLLTFSSSLHAAYTPNHRDSGWVALFNGKNLDGLYPHLQGGSWGENYQNIVTVHDSMIHFYQGWKRVYGSNNPIPQGVLSTGIDFSHYQSRVVYKAGDPKDNGWLAGDPFNSGFFYHAQAGGPVWPPAIECQLKIHWSSKTGACLAAGADCDQVWAGDFWLLSDVQITKDGVTNNSGATEGVPGNHNPDPELVGWNQMEIEVHGDSLFKNILNGTEINHGTKSTWINSDKQKVPLKKGRVQLELDGSEFFFKNWEIRLFKQDSLYNKWYVEGCMDPGYKEYSKTANLHMQSYCKSLNAASFVKSHIDFNQPGQYEITVKDFTGKIVAQYLQTNPKSLDIGSGLKTGLYFMEVKKGNEKFYSKFSHVE